METTLHRQLKTLYATDDQKEVTLDRYRIDAIDDLGRLVEVQCAGLSAIRDKIKRLVKSHDVVVVKPIIMRRVLVKRKRKKGKVVSRRRSPKRGNALDLFEDLVHFCNVFPHERLTLELAFVEIEEHRLPPLKRRWRQKYRVEDRVLLEVLERVQLVHATDLNGLFPTGLPSARSRPRNSPNKSVSRVGSPRRSPTACAKPERWMWSASNATPSSTRKPHTNGQPNA